MLRYGKASAVSAASSSSHGLADSRPSLLPYVLVPTSLAFLIRHPVGTHLHGPALARVRSRNGLDLSFSRCGVLWLTSIIVPSNSLTHYV